MYSKAVFSVSIVSLQRMNIEALEKVSITVNIVSYMFERGSFVIKQG